MDVSISSWSYRKWFADGKCDLLSFVDEVKRQEADGFEIFPHHVDADDPGQHLRQVAAQAEKANLRISAVIAANDFARASATERADQVERMKEWIVHTKQAGVDRMNVFTGYHQSGEDPVVETYRVVDAYREVAPVAEEHGVLLCMENHSTVCHDADSLLWLLKAVGSDHLVPNPDPTNFVADYQIRGERAREKIYSETTRYAPGMANAHLKIADFTENGDHAYVDVPRLIDIFREVGYDGHVVLEYYGQDDPAEPVAKGIALLRRILGTP